MAVSYATVDSTKMELSPMRVSFKGPAAVSAVDLGGTLGNVVIDMKYEKADIKADQLGTTVLDRRVKGLIVTVTTEIAEVQNFDLWKVVFPHADKGTDMTKGDFVEFRSQVGDGDLSNAGVLTLHPLSTPDSDVTKDFTFFLACGDAQSAITYGPDQQAKLKIVWNILPDTSVVPAAFFIHGDPTLKL